MRRLTIGALACVAGLSVARADVPFESSRTRPLDVSTPAARGDWLSARRLRSTVGDTPWSIRARAELRGTPSAASPIVLGDGRVIVALETPASLLWIRDGAIDRVARLDDRPAGDLTLAGDGRVIVPVMGRAVYAVAPDATVRAVLSMAPMPPARHASLFSIDHGRTMLFASDAGGEATLFVLAPDGTLAGNVAVLSPPGVFIRPIAGPDGCVWLPTTAGVACYDSTARVMRGPVQARATNLAPIDSNTLVLARHGALEFRSADGGLRATVAVEGVITSLSPLPGDRMALHRTTGADVQEIWVVSREGTVHFRATVTEPPLPPVLAAADGSVVAAFRGGEVVAWTDDGRERWRVSLRETLASGPVPAPGGGIVVTTRAGSLLTLR